VDYQLNYRGDSSRILNELSSIVCNDFLLLHERLIEMISHHTLLPAEVEKEERPLFSCVHPWVKHVYLGRVLYKRKK